MQKWGWINGCDIWGWTDVASAAGFAEATAKPTTLVVGDVSTLHDIGSFHNLAERTRSSKHGQSKRPHPLTTLVVNNDGGGIFSFLPIARHGDDVSFDELFGTPTNSFSFQKACEAFGLPYRKATEMGTLTKTLSKFSPGGLSSLVEVVVASREQNVLIHKRISRDVASYVDLVLASDLSAGTYPHRSYVKSYSNDFQRPPVLEEKKTVVLLHGWMGDKTDWDEVGLCLSGMLPSGWSVEAVDLVQYGEESQSVSVDTEILRRSLCLPLQQPVGDLSVGGIAETVLKSLRSHGVTKVDALVGYSLGGRVALNIVDRFSSAGGLIHNDTRLVLLSSFTESKGTEQSQDSISRKSRDDLIAQAIRNRWLKACLYKCPTRKVLCWDEFLENWYSSPLWAEIDCNPGFPEMKRKRSMILEGHGTELAEILSCCSPPRNVRSVDSKGFPTPTFLVAGELDNKYCELMMRWLEENKGQTKFDKVKGAGHAILLENPLVVAEKIADFLQRKDALPDHHSCEDSPSAPCSKFAESSTLNPDVIEGSVGNFKARTKRFTLEMVDSSGRRSSVSGLGWGERAIKSSKLASRNGLLLQLQSTGCGSVGLGEISPLKGVHDESLEDVIVQIQKVQAVLERGGDEVNIDPRKTLELRGYLSDWIHEQFSGIQLFPSVRAGVEMALLGLSAHKLGAPLYQAILLYAFGRECLQKSWVELNGFMTRMPSQGFEASYNFRSTKVKVGHRSRNEDIDAIVASLGQLDATVGRENGNLRLDANRSWNRTEAKSFVDGLEELRIHDRIDFIEEPLYSVGGVSFKSHVASLEEWSHQVNIPYALDESIAELAFSHGFKFSLIEKEMLHVFKSGQRGCVALVLKPSLLGMELSIQIARLARQKLKMGAVFSSCFESGTGLAHVGSLAAASDAIESEACSFSHGLGTYVLLGGDTITPPFSSYVNGRGMLNIASISRAMYGLSLDEMAIEDDVSNLINEETIVEEFGSEEDELSTIVSIDLPFSAKTAHSRFTDLPQQPRWSPWLSSVSYQGEESEWKINIRGIPLRWRAKSQLMTNPWLGIQWESVSGVPNRGKVEFIPKNSETCQMKVCIAIIPPRVLNPLFRRAKSLVLEDFISNKIVKWSLEMFRDVVKADLAIESGDVELGDALFGAVEGKATAIEETLKFSSKTGE